MGQLLYYFIKVPNGAIYYCTSNEATDISCQLERIQIMVPTCVRVIEVNKHQVIFYNK